MVLRPGSLYLAQLLQESADGLTSSDVRARLSDALSDSCRGTGCWAYYVDHIGDGESGDLIYYKDGDTFRCPYEISGTAGTSAKCVLGMDKAIDVVPRTIYEPEQDEAEHYAAMEAANLYTKGPVPLVERFIGKTERAAADSKSFAGKGKSFPLLKKEDVKAAVRSMGRAGTDNYSSDVIRKNIKRIATEKGWTGELPSSWQDGEQSHEGEAESRREAAAGAATGEVRIQESAQFAGEVNFTEAACMPLVKIISPGRGSSGFYSKEVLQASVDKFKRGTLMYINHATPAEEAQRPEGDWSKLAAVTSGDAYWDENGKDGAAIYAPAKVFSGHAAEVAEKAPHTGVSIRARGKRDDKAIAPDGKPGVITELNHVESIDLVTKAGRDGKLLLESATDSDLTEGGAMDAEELKKLQEANRNIAKRLAKSDAKVAAEQYVESLRLPQSAKVSIVERAISNVPITEAGEFDSEGFKKVMEAEVQYAASFMAGGVKAVGVGAAAPPDPKVVEAQRDARVKERERWLNRSAAQLNIKSDAGRAIFREGRRAFDPLSQSA